MKYFNLNLSIMRSPEYIGADPVQRATWLALVCWCCEQENGGIIENCREWKDRTWQQLCGVTLEEVLDECDLFSWNGDWLVINFYPSDKQNEVIAKREYGKRGGRPKSKEEPCDSIDCKKAESRTKPQQNHVVNHAENHMVQMSENGKEGKGREMKGKEENNTPSGVFTRADFPSDVLPMPQTVTDVEDFMSQLTERPMAAEALSESAERFFDYFVLQKRHLANWRSRARLWAKEDAKKWAEHQQRQGIKRKKPEQQTTIISDDYSSLK